MSYYLLVTVGPGAVEGPQDAARNGVDGSFGENRFPWFARKTFSLPAAASAICALTGARSLFGTSTRSNRSNPIS